MWPSSRPSIVLVLHVIVHGDVVVASVSVIVQAFDATTAPQRPQERPRLPLVRLRGSRAIFVFVVVFVIQTAVGVIATMPQGAQ